jgi:hypothetical protein
VSAGANVKAVQRMLGHKSAVMTLDVYAGLFDDDLDALAARMDVSDVSNQNRVLKLSSSYRNPMVKHEPELHMDVSDADVEQMWNSADVITLPTARNPL